MGLSKEVRDLLQQGREDALAVLAGADSRALRPLVGRLWDPDGEIRQRASRVLGRAAAADAESGVEIIRRLMWALNDESATNGVYAIPALGEIGRRAPELLAPFVSALVSLSRDRGVRLTLLEALTAVAEGDPRLTAPHLDRLETTIDRSRLEERRAFRRLVEVTREGDRRAD
jgi:hypothetical protein